MQAVIGNTVAQIPAGMTTPEATATHHHADLFKTALS
jgi:hypothetical protein